MTDDLKSLFTGYWNYLAVNAACELNLFDKVLDGNKTLEILGRAYDWNHDALDSLVNILKDEGLLQENNFLELTEKGKFLTSTHPNSLYYACMHWAKEHMDVWQSLSYTIRTGKSTFEKLYGEPYFEYLNKNPDKLVAYQKAMHEYAQEDYRDICRAIDCSNYNEIIDVGGGYGALLKHIKKENPSTRCILFDLPEVVENLTGDSIEIIAGDFFAEIPIQGQAIILSRVLHDWNDEKATLILRNCYNALRSNGVLHIIEILTDKMNIRPHQLNLNMQAVCNSKERSSFDYEKLLEGNGFTIKNQTKVNELQYVISATK